MNDESEAGLSRRDFLKSAGLASIAAVPAQAHAAKAPPPPDRALILGPGQVPVRLLVNGTERHLRVEPRTTLAHALREGLGLTGTKIACDRGACGACTVWIDGQPATSCMVLALDVAAVGHGGGAHPAAITTIEGLAHGDKLHEVQQAFIQHDALQCGYCTPGMIMSCAALVEKCWAQGTTPDEEQVRGAIAGNLCRCGTYPHVLRATLEAAGHGQPPGGPR